jgi:hypothetical protein
MKYKSFITSVACFIAFSMSANHVVAQADAVGMFDKHEDIGHPKNPGAATYDKVTHTYF